MAGPLPVAPLWPYIRCVTGPDPLLVFDRAMLRGAARARGTGLGESAPFSSKRSRAAWWSAWTTSAAAFRGALDLGLARRRGRRPALGERRTVGLAGARRPRPWGLPACARGPGHSWPNEERLPFAPQSFDLVVSAMDLQLGQRPARHPGPDPPHPEARRPAPRRHAGRRRRCGSCARHWPRPKARSRAASARASRPSPICATPPACCSARASPCRWPTARRSTSNTPMRARPDARSRRDGREQPGRRAPARPRRAAPRLLRAAEIYGERFTLPSGRGCRRASRCSSCTAGRRMKSQPKPLRPGSAARRLADALGTDRAERRRESGAELDRAAEIAVRRSAVGELRLLLRQHSGCSSISSPFPWIIVDRASASPARC